jgi:hypothetical protein
VVDPAHAARRAGPGRPRLVQGLEAEQAESLFAAVVFPHFLFALHGDGMTWYQVLPAGPGRFMLNIHLCVPKYVLGIAEAEAILAEMEAVVTAIHVEDIAVNDLVWRGLQAPLTGQGRLSSLEGAIWQMNQLWLAAMEA